MDIDNVHLAHPAYTQVIRQLSADEAQILHEIHRYQKAGAAAKKRYTMDINHPAPPHWKNIRVELDEMSRETLQFPNNFDFYFQHLFSMGLAAIYKVDEKPTLNPDRSQRGTRVLEEYRLTEFGSSFMNAVTKEK